MTTAALQRWLLGRGGLSALMLVALGIGLAGHLVGPTERIQLLAPPLLALMAWNLVVYLLLVIATWQRRSPRQAPDPSPQPARLAAALHAAAAVLAVGAIAGLYLRGLAVEFRAGWDSTFLDAAGVHALLSLVLGPAAWLTGQTLPDVARIEALRFTTGSGENAARWIHLYALTTAVVVVLPRALLAIGSARQARRAAAGTRSAGAPLFAGHGTACRALVQPVSYQVDAGLQKALGDAITAALGSGLVLTWRPSIGLDEEFPRSAEPQALPLFAMTATPEDDTHGRLLRQRLGALPRSDTAPLALVDESGFRRRLAPADRARRLAERRVAWQGLIESSGHRALFLDPAAAIPAPDAGPSPH